MDVGALSGRFPRGGTDAARAPVEDTLAPHVYETDEQNQKERDDLDEPGPPEVAQRNGPRIQESHLDIEQQEDHRDEVELDRLALASVADRGHAALIRRQLFRRRVPRSEQHGEPDHDAGEADTEHDHDDYAEPAVHCFPPRNACEEFLNLFM